VVVTTLFHLVRHATHGCLGKVLLGRMPGVTLAEEGHRQACSLARHFSGQQIAAIQSSPRERAMETAAPIARMSNRPLDVADAIDEIDMGEWTGRSFAALRSDPDWQLWNARRAEVRPPNGESMLELQRRTVHHLNDMRSAHPGARIVLVSHAEPIRALALHCFGMPLSDFARIEIAPASVTTIAVGEQTWSLLSLNEAVTA
jgi:probable phosphoglycerate mutase